MTKKQRVRTLAEAQALCVQALDGRIDPIWGPPMDTATAVVWSVEITDKMHLRCEIPKNKDGTNGTPIVLFYRTNSTPRMCFAITNNGPGSLSHQINQWQYQYAGHILTLAGKGPTLYQAKCYAGKQIGIGFTDLAFMLGTKPASVFMAYKKAVRHLGGGDNEP